MKLFYFHCIFLQALREEKKKTGFRGKGFGSSLPIFSLGFSCFPAFILYWVFWGLKNVQNVYFKYQIIIDFEHDKILEPPYILTKILLKNTVYFHSTYIKMSFFSFHIF